MPADDANSGKTSNDETTDPGANIAIGQIVLGAVVGIILGVLASHFVQPTTRALLSAASTAAHREICSA